MLAVTSNYLVMVDTSTFMFIIKKFISIYSQYGAGVNLSNGMFVITALKSSVTGYITMFLPESFNSHPDLTSTTITMNEISSTTNSIISESFTIGSPITETVTSFTPAYYSPTYVVIKSENYQQVVTNV